ncbi:hypothetical protein [Treponema sp.]|uniref:hypothetical protein n=1 Tax=Treponema sp. TaxID=166 RepID=UPI0025E0B2DA|nr:hypothetical protein [Treponema sp.]MCR5218385.1 hypothetical protein [Treponema sp.]
MKKLILTAILFYTANLVFSQNTPAAKNPGTSQSVSPAQTVSAPQTAAEKQASSESSTNLSGSNSTAASTAPAKKDSVKQPEDDQMTFTFYTTQTMSLMNSSSRTYFSLPAESEEASITEIIPVNETMFRLTVSIPSKTTAPCSYHIYVKKGEILGIKSKGAVFIGSVESFDYNSFAILGKKF